MTNYFQKNYFGWESNLFRITFSQACVFPIGQKPVTGGWDFPMGKAAPCSHAFGVMGATLHDKELSIFPASQSCFEIYNLPCPGQSKQKGDHAGAAKRILVREGCVHTCGHQIQRLIHLCTPSPGIVSDIQQELNKCFTIQNKLTPASLLVTFSMTLDQSLHLLS